MRMKYIVLAASVVAVSMVGFPVLADHHGEGKRGGKMFEKADTNWVWSSWLRPGGASVTTSCSSLQNLMWMVTDR